MRCHGRHSIKIDEDLKQYEAVLLNGCAVLGAAHLGFLLSLEAERKLRFLKVMSGVSIGSIVALFYLAKIPLDFVAQEFRERTMISLLQPLDNVHDMLNESGFSKTDGIIALCRHIITSSSLLPDTLTFKKLFEVGRSVELVIVASKYDTSSGTFIPVYFTTSSHPDMLVLDAVRLSINIPFLFVTPIFQGDQYVDGVLTDELPFTYIQKQYNIDVDCMIAHAPHSTSLTEPSFLSVLIKHCLTKVRTASAPHRVLHTALLLPNQLAEVTASRELIDYFIISGIINTRKFLHCNNE